MTNFKSRIDKIERTISELRFAQGGIRVCFQEHGQTEAEALAAAGIDPDDNALTVYVMHWAAGTVPGTLLYGEATAPKPDSAATIDAKIAKLKAELLRDGVSAMEISELESDFKNKGDTT